MFDPDKFIALVPAGKADEGTVRAAVLAAGGVCGRTLALDVSLNRDLGGMVTRFVEVWDDEACRDVCPPQWIAPLTDS